MNKINHSSLIWNNSNSMLKYIAVNPYNGIPKSSKNEQTGSAWHNAQKYHNLKDYQKTDTKNHAL